MTRVIRRYLLPSLAGVLLAMLFLAVDGEHGLRRLLALRGREGDVEGRIARLEQERDRLLQSVHELRSDPVAIERVARQKLRMVREGEIVLQLPPAGPGRRVD